MAILVVIAIVTSISLATPILRETYPLPSNLHPRTPKKVSGPTNDFRFHTLAGNGPASRQEGVSAQLGLDEFGV